MTKTRNGLRAAAGLLFMIFLIGCGAETPAGKGAGTAGGKGASKEEEGSASAESPASERGETLDAIDKEVLALEETPASAEAEEDDKGPPEQPNPLPTLAELDSSAEWIDNQVLDSMKLLLEKQAKEKPQVTVPEALALKNTSRDANEKILSALGRATTDDSQVNYEATLNRHFRRDIKSTNPIMINQVEEMEIVSLTGISLITIDWTLAPFAPDEIVKSWQTSKDRMMDKFVIRDDLIWSDGRPVTAHDISFSFRTIMNEKVPVPAVRSGTDKLKWVQAYDDHTVVFFHKKALATNVWNVQFPIIPRHIYEESVKEDPTMQNSDYHVKFENDPVTCGAFSITKRQRGQEIVLTRNERWFMRDGKQIRQKPYFKEIRCQIIEDPNTALRSLRNGDLDEMILTPEQWTTQTNDDGFYKHNTKASGLEWTYFGFQWNLKSPFFSDLKVRQAMSYAFDYKEMLDKLNYGLYEPSNGMFHPTAWMAPKNPPPYYHQDLDKAEELLDQAGWTDHDGDGIRDKEIDGKSVPFKFTILCPPVTDRVKLCTLLKENLSQIGITCEVAQLESTVMIDRLLKHEFQAAFGGWGTGADPDSSENIWGTGQGRNFGQYSNVKVDRLYSAGRKEFDRKKRAAIYGRIGTLVYADLPYTWLYFRNSFYAFNKNLRGYMFSPRDPFGYSPGLGSIYKVKQ